MMIYFVNRLMQENKSGIEHAQIKRLKLFRSHNVPAKILTRDYDRGLHHNFKETDISDDEIINIFDWLQDARSVPNKILTPEDIIFKSGHRLSKNGNVYEVFSGDRKIADIKMWAPNFDSVESVTYFDRFNNLLKRDLFDVRGFKSMEQIFDSDGNSITERMFTPEGRLVFESSWLNNKHDQTSNSLLRVVDYKGKTYSFNGIKTMFRWFLDELNTADGYNSTFIHDRFENDWSILNMQTKAYKILHIHSVHTNDAHDMLHASLNYNYEYSLDNLDKWDGMITATQKQRDDIIRRWHPDFPVYVLPVGIVSNQELQTPRIPMAERKRHNVVLVARQSPEKQIDQAIKAIKNAHPAIPDITFDVYGYGPEKTKKELHDLVVQESATDYIHLHDYTADVNSVYNNAQASLLTSSSEGFALVLLESITHGVPVVSYNIAYGPADIIQSGVNGELVQEGAYLDISQVLINLFKDDKLLQKVSDGAYDSSRKFSEDNVWLKWRELLSNVGYDKKNLAV